MAMRVSRRALARQVEQGRIAFLVVLVKGPWQVAHFKAMWSEALIRHFLVFGKQSHGLPTNWVRIVPQAGGEALYGRTVGVGEFAIDDLNGDMQPRVRRGQWAWWSGASDRRKGGQE